MKWLVTETVEYRVEADSRDEVEELFLGELGPGAPPDGSPVVMGDVTERMIEEAG